MNVFTIEATHGKYAVMETLMNHFPDCRYTAERDNCAFIINDNLTPFPFPNRCFSLGWNEDTDTKKMAKIIYDRAFAYGFKNIFVYTNEPKNSTLVDGLISGFKAHLIPDDFQGNYACGNVFVFCQPSC